MKISVYAKPKSHKEYIKQVDENHYIVAVKEPPAEGYANRAIIKALADFFQKSPSQLEIISGETSKNKIIEIYE
ncbi:MAG: hypothetical protein UV73_C0010G0059 [Candidatus Gottesmanbacteria bacterium GW2011_GWA2_43_14]|uniref:Uncharacterized protein n=1 Tax=Candidatus Gottesmanbacteria bacterium GW2011_GWA2_43_14 TaxID=1618443 RepID=A0A0G1DFQ3_9BACT|nr:MAG: hypothetical protein UV73_C0010G0059 [Candidatus Gottesmanbacteria bacterium GW2011_GWA2_43_14]